MNPDYDPEIKIESTYGHEKINYMLNTITWSGVRSMKKARDAPQERLRTDTMMPAMIDGGNWPVK